jgi:hypothetical protein
VILLSVGNLTSGQRAALFQLLASRPGARSLGELTDAMGRRGVGVELGGLRVIIDPETSDILQTSEVSGPRRPTRPPPTGRPEAPVASARVASRAHRGLLEHGQRRRARDRPQ